MVTEHFPDPPSTREIHTEEALNLRLLQQSFDAFKQATLKLQAYYHGLEEKADELNRELVRKNKELQMNLLEKERTQSFLSNIFASFAVGCIVTDSGGVVNYVNQMGLQLLGSPLEKLHGVELNEVFQHPILPQTLTREELRIYDNAKEQELDFQQPNGLKKRLLLSISSMRSEAEEISGIIVKAAGYFRHEKTGGRG